MTSVYTDADYLSVYKQRKRIYNLFYAVTGVYLAFCLGWLIYYIGLPYKDPMQKWVKIAVFSVTVVYVGFACIYLSIKGSRISRYYKLLTTISEGLKSEERNYFYEFREKLLQKNNVDVSGCIFEAWNKKKTEWMDREAYWDSEKPLPPFHNGDFVYYVVQSNVIVQYEILEKQALEFELVDEDDEEEGYAPEEDLQEETVKI